MEVAEFIVVIMTILGGLGIFLFGINLMGDSLKALAGSKLKVILEKATNTPLKGILVGALVTAIIQSSSGTTALAIGLVSVGLLTFPQAVGVIFGANIGTTVTSLLTGAGIEEYALWFVGIGAIIVFFVKHEKVKQAGHAILGFGFLFFGLGLMGDSLKEVLTAYENEAKQLFSSFDGDWGWLLGLLSGAGITAIVQSSSATVGLLQEVYVESTLSIEGALPILFGCNIGTTITGMIAALGGNKDARKTSFIHTVFNALGALLFLLLLKPFASLMGLIEQKIVIPSGMETKMTLAFAHIIFNLVTTFILYFFINLLIKLTNKVIKEKEVKDESTFVDDLLDHQLIKSSTVMALALAKKALDYMVKQVQRFIIIARDYSFTRNDDFLVEGASIETTINLLDKRIHDYLVELMVHDMSNKNSKLLSKYLDQIKDLERLGDHCKNLLEFFKERYDKDYHLSSDGRQDLKQIYNTLIEMCDATVLAIGNWSKEKAQEVLVIEDEIDRMTEVFHNRHVHRLDKGVCSVLNAEHFIEILSNIERMGDHLENICESIIYDSNEEKGETKIA